MRSKLFFSFLSQTCFQNYSLSEKIHSNRIPVDLSFESIIQIIQICDRRKNNSNAILASFKPSSRHANYKYKHNTSKLENEAMYTNYTCTTKTKTT